MITIFVHDGNTRTVTRLLDTAPVLSKRLRFVTYRKAFARREAPTGTLIFTDFDLLHAVEIDAAAAIANMALSLYPETRILNHPAITRERVPLLAQMFRAGLNQVEVRRLDTGDMPTRYPVFIRSEDGAYGPETDLIHDEASLKNEMAQLQDAGRTLKRRIVVSFDAQRDGDGYFRKYGAFVIGDRIIPQHILRNVDWNVKSSSSMGDPAFAAEEEAYIVDNPHEAHLDKISRLAGIQFGRIDYTLVDGAPVIFEINTNPTFPRFTGGDPVRENRRGLILQRLVDAFDEIDTKVSHTPAFGFNITYGVRQNLAGADRWYNDLPYSLIQRRRWSKLYDRFATSRTEE